LVIPFNQLKLNRELTFIEIETTDFFIKMETIRGERIDGGFMNRITKN